jgi:hypothetical protein
VKDSIGNVVVKPRYAYIDDFSQGLAVAFLDYRDGRILYGFIDTKGNTTFRNSDLEKYVECENKWIDKEKKAEAKRIEEEKRLAAAQNATWLQGSWVGEYNGALFQMIIEGDRLIQKVDGKSFYNGTYFYDGKDMICFNKTSNSGWKDVWSVDSRRHVLLLNDTPMRKQNGTMSNNGNYSNSSQNSSNQNSSYRFVNPESVIDYLSHKKFSNGVNRVKITYQGVFVNGNCMTGAPRVVRYTANEALVTATIVGLNAPPMRLLVDPVENKITDLEDGSVFYSK